MGLATPPKVQSEGFTTLVPNVSDPMVRPVTAGAPVAVAVGVSVPVRVAVGDTRGVGVPVT